MTKYFGYIRVSTAKQGEHSSSLQEQRAAIEAFAKRQGLSISNWFEEQETAAKQGRTQFRKMLTALTRGDARGVIIHKIDRSARNLRDWADLGTLIDRGIEVHFANENLDLQSRGGRLSADIQAVVAADYIRNLREEVKKGLYGRLKQGYYPLKAPVGYIDHGSAQVKTICPAKGPIVRRAFELYATGHYSLDLLNTELRRLGLRNKWGGCFSRNGLSVMLNNPFYYGLIRIKRTGETFVGNHEPLISKDLFDKVQAVLRQRVKVTTGIKRDYLLQRMIRCSGCGNGLYAEQHKGITYYRCQSRSCPKTSLREDSLVQYVGSDIARMGISDALIDTFAAMFRVHIADLLADRASAQKALELALGGIQDRSKRLTDAYLDRAIDRDTYDERKTALQNERVALNEKMRELQDNGASYMERENHFLETLKRLPLLAQLEDAGEKRSILKSAISNFTVTGKHVEIAWDVPLQRMLARPIITYGGPSHDTSGTFVPAGHDFTSSVTNSVCESGLGVALDADLIAQIIRLVLTGANDTAAESQMDERLVA